MARMISITVPGDLPALNEIIDAAKYGWQKYCRIKKLNTKKVMYSAMGECIKPFRFVDIEVTWYCKDKRKDKDNIAAGMKFILDGLVAARVIPNDTWEYVNSFSHHFEVDKNDPRIEVVVEEVRNGC